MDYTIIIHTDGACRGNPGPGGWAALLNYNKHKKSIYGFEKNTTNNRMELTAAIKALSSLKKSSKVILITDSNYVKNGITKWISNWKKNNWKTSSKKQVKNTDLWQILDNLSKEHDITWKWTKAHAGNPDNELVDGLANKAIDEMLQ
jgi:ribonuclease HI